MPLDGKSNLLLRYRGAKRTFPYVSAADVLSGKTPAGAFADKIVFVGTTALGTREVVATPLDTLFAGVEVQATVADNLLQQDFIRRPEYGVARRDAGACSALGDRRVAAGRAVRSRPGAARRRRLSRGRLGGRRRADVGATASFCRRSFRRSACSCLVRRDGRSRGSPSSVAGPIRRATTRSCRSA